MGWKFSKSIKMGPLRVNLSKSGVGYSVGVKGMRAGVDAKGRKYSHVSILGTGISNRTYEDKSQLNQSQNTGVNHAQSGSVGWLFVIVAVFVFYIIKSLF